MVNQVYFSNKTSKNIKKNLTNKKKYYKNIHVHQIILSNSGKTYQNILLGKLSLEGLDNFYINR